MLNHNLCDKQQSTNFGTYLKNVESSLFAFLLHTNEVIACVKYVPSVTRQSFLSRYIPFYQRADAMSACLSTFNSTQPRYPDDGSQCIQHEVFQTVCNRVVITGITHSIQLIAKPVTQQLKLQNRVQLAAFKQKRWHLLVLISKWLVLKLLHSLIPDMFI